MGPLESFFEGCLGLDAPIVTRQVRGAYDVSGTDLVMLHFRRANLTDFTWLSTNPTGIVKGELLEGLVVEIRSVVGFDFGDALFGRTGKC